MVNQSLQVDYVIEQLVYARPLGLNVGPIWFLAALFDVTILFFVFYKVILSKNNIYLSLVFLGLISIVAFYLPKLENKFDFFLPFKLDCSLMALVFYSVGYLTKEYMSLLWNDKKVIIKLILVVTSICVIVVFPYFILGNTYLSGGIYGSDLFVYLFTAICGSVLLMIVGMFFYKSTVLSFIGKNSLIIFILHSFCLVIYSKILGILGIKASLITSIIGTVAILLFLSGVTIIYNFLKSKINLFFMNRKKEN